jgi:hypothetical protein
MSSPRGQTLHPRRTHCPVLQIRSDHALSPRQRHLSRLCAKARQTDSRYLRQRLKSSRRHAKNRRLISPSGSEHDPRGWGPRPGVVRFAVTRVIRSAGLGGRRLTTRYAEAALRLTVPRSSFCGVAAYDSGSCAGTTHSPQATAEPGGECQRHFIEERFCECRSSKGNTDSE